MAIQRTCQLAILVAAMSLHAINFTRSDINRGDYCMTSKQTCCLNKEGAFINKSLNIAMHVFIRTIKYIKPVQCSPLTVFQLRNAFEWLNCSCFLRIHQTLCQLSGKVQANSNQKSFTYHIKDMSKSQQAYSFVYGHEYS